jgi:hypothetical protein
MKIEDSKFYFHGNNALGELGGFPVPLIRILS